MKKRLISLCVCLCILTSICTGYFATTSASATTENNVNKNLLEAMLNNRLWVIDTLINDDYSTNPHAMVNDMANEKSMMATVLSQYGNKNDPNYSAAYKAVVDALYAWHHAGDYAKDVADYATEWTADIFEFFGGSDSAVSALRRCADSSKTMQYDNILQEVLKADYTSSSGQTLKGSNSQLVQLRKIQDGVGMLKSFASASKNLSGLDDGMAHTAASYADTVLFPAADAYQDVMNNVAKLTGSDMGENEQALLDLTTALGTVAVYDSIVVSENNSGGAITIAPAYLLDEDTKKIIDINADAAKFADITIDSFMYVASIQTQKESVAGVLDRTSEHLANAQTRDLLGRYSDLIKDAADGKTSNYDLILTSIRNSGYIEKYAESKISDALKKLRNRFIPCYDQSIIPGAIASATGVVGTATYLADAVTGLEDTSTKTVELKNLNQLIAFFKATFERDLANYKSNPTDENAAKVLDDLDFIQRLRLRGETIAYKMSANQLSKPLGKLLSGGSDETLKDFYAYDYQRHIDAILGASIVPYTTDSITVGNGQTLSVYYDPNYGGLYAKYDKGSGNLFNSYGIAELNYRTANGINVSNGGKVLTMSDNASSYMPYIINNGGSVLLAGNMKLSELTQNSGTTQLGANTYQIDNLYLSGGSVQTANGGTINTENLNISGTVTANLPITCTNNMNLSGTLTGNIVYLKGNSSGSGTLNNLVVSGNGTQNLSGTINATNLIYRNTGTVNQAGTINVSGSVQNASSRVTNGQNTILKSTGEIIGSHYNSSITVDGVTISEAKTINGMLKTKNTVNLGDVNINGSLNQTNGTLNLNGHVNVLSDSYFGGTVIQGDYDYFAKGDISGSKITLGNLNMCGNVAQTISNAITTNNFYNNNTNGLNINAKVTVNGKVKSVKSPVNGQNITLQETASFENAPYYGDVTVKGLVGSFPSYIYGNVYLQSDITQSSNTCINNLIFTKGTLELQNSDMTIKGILNNSSEDTHISLDETSTLIIKGDATIKGNINGTGSIVSYGDITNSGTIDVYNLIITANMPIAISGKAITTSNLKTAGKSRISLSCQINVLKEYTENNSNIDSSKVVFSQGNILTEDLVYDTPLNITGDLIIDGFTLKANKGLNVKTGNIILTNGAELIVNGKASITGTSSQRISVDESSSIYFDNVAIIDTLNSIDINGILNCMGDMSLKSTTLSGDGTISLRGDLYCSSVKINQPNSFKIIGKTPQTISVSGANFKNLYILNPSRGGVSFSSSVNCYGEYNKNDSNVSGTVTQK